jgi:C1A family cysteine protease
MRFLVVLLSLVCLSAAAELGSYKEYLVFAAKNHYKTVTDYANAIGVTQLDTEFNDFKVKYERKYTSEEEEERKFYFLKTIQFIESHNKLYASGDVTHEVGINLFADWTPEEYAALKGTHSFNSTDAIIIENPGFVPYSAAAFDWRSSGKVSPVKNQGQCGSCWAFATAATIESAYLIKFNQLVTLSEQNLLDCAYAQNTCAGGYVYKAMEYARDNGLERDSDYRYEMRRGTCRNNGGTYHARISGYERLYMQQDEVIKNALAAHGPMVAHINADGDDFKQYRGGIITGGSTAINHAVTLIGWGPGYWIVKNSWSASWGEQGFFRIASGRNVRNINNDLYYPTL